MTNTRTRKVYKETVQYFLKVVEQMAFALAARELKTSLRDVERNLDDFITIWVTYGRELPSEAEVLAAIDRGKARYEKALAKPMPLEWPTGTPSDSYLVRFPGQIGIFRDSASFVKRFWGSFKNFGTQHNFYFDSGSAVSCDTGPGSKIGYGNCSRTAGYLFIRGARVILSESHRSGDIGEQYEFVCPTPKETYAWIQEGKSIKDLIRARIVLKTG